MRPCGCGGIRGRHNKACKLGLWKPWTAADKLLKSEAALRQQHKQRTPREVTDAQLQDLELSATFMLTKRYVTGCVCAGYCVRCREKRDHARKITPEIVLDLIAAIRERNERLREKP